MPRPKGSGRIDKPVATLVQIRQSIIEEVDRRLFSELEDRVPYGARSALINELLSEWLEKKRATL